ncbi:MAG: hypothetical protein ACQER9_04360 [Nanobdellota archaeon]
MEEFEDLLKKADDKIYVAEHMLSNTYSLLGDPKLLLAIVENVGTSYQNAISGFLLHERLFKRIPPYNRTPDSELTFFYSKVVPKYGIDKNYIQDYQKIKETIKAHKDSPVEFSRKGNYVIASDSFNLKKVSPDEIKEEIKKCKGFLKIIKKKLGGKND